MDAQNERAVSELAAALTRALGEQRVMLQEPMANHTTFEIGGPAEILVTPASIDDVAQTVALCGEYGVPFRVMGLGSNILVSDEGLPGVVIKFAEDFAAIEVDGTVIHAQAGASNAAVAEAAQAAGLAGYEFASGIPGSIGGAAVMNAGAYDGEFAHVCTNVTCLRPDGTIVNVPAAEAQWGYRHSLMMDDGSIVLGADLQLCEGDPAAIRATMDDLKQRRESKQPLDMPSAGSTFKRPEGYFAGKLIQDAGLRGYSVGGAQVSEKHCGFVVNKGGATAADVCQLIADVQDKVFAMEGVRLEPEVRMWGFE